MRAITLLIAVLVAISPIGGATPGDQKASDRQQSPRYVTAVLTVSGMT